jgi:hypothetical protein
MPLRGRSLSSLKPPAPAASSLNTMKNSTKRNEVRLPGSGDDRGDASKPKPADILLLFCRQQAALA